MVSFGRCGNLLFFPPEFEGLPLACSTTALGLGDNQMTTLHHYLKTNPGFEIHNQISHKPGSASRRVSN